MSNRDDFPRSVQTDLSLRAGLLCSNPACKILTKGPAELRSGVTSIGIACHIKAAAPGGPRFGETQSKKERSSIENGIWLCANCARLIDAEPAKYPVGLLHDWKKTHEDTIRRSLGQLQWDRREKNVLVLLDLYHPEPGDWRNGPEAILKYEAQRRDGVLAIRPALPYLGRFSAGDTIQPLSYLTPTHTSFQWSFPTLDIKVLNNTDQTVLLTDLVIDVGSSDPTPTPLLVIQHDSQRRWAGQLKLIDEGGAKVTDLALAFRLLPPGTNAEEAGHLRVHTVTVPTLDRTATVSLWEAISAEGVDVAGLRRLAAGESEEDGPITIKDGDGQDVRLTPDQWEAKVHESFGPFLEGKGVVSGTMTFTTDAGTERASGHSVKFEAPLHLFDQNKVGVARPITYGYSAVLKPDGRSYRVSRSIAQELKPGEADRFSLELAATHSAEHRMTVAICDISGRTVAMGTVDLKMFIPLSSAGTVARSLGLT